MTPTLFFIAATFVVLMLGGSTAYIIWSKKNEQGAFGQSASARASGAASAAAMSSLVKGKGFKKKLKKKPLTLDEKFFQAGLFSDSEKRDFRRLQKIAPIVGAVLMTLLVYQSMGGTYALLGTLFGVALGMQFPITILDKKIKKRSEEIMYYLPLVVEQLVVGVSSSLDIGPCIQRVSEIADERGTHNCVTELLKLSQYYIRSGVALPEALLEIGTLSGHNELKHTFLSLAQVVQHGGEVSKRLIEIADSVSQMREIQIEEKIKKLELVATGPVGLVFMGFMAIILVGFGLQMTAAF